MAPLTIASRALAREASKRFAVRAISTTTALRDSAHSTGSYTSPFKGDSKATKIPDFGHYAAKAGSASTNSLVSYFMVGTMGALAAAGAKSTIQGEWW
jgi:ubiquinol-cytochrome c reductase iron-sulfur subunit